MVKEQHYVFQLDKTRIYEVHVEPSILFIAPKINEPTQDGFNFSHSGAIFNRPKTDFNRCGQCQKDVTKDFPEARRFCEKLEEHHLCRMTDELYAEFCKDILLLCETYNYIKTDKFPTFSEERELSMNKPRTDKTKQG